MQASGGEAGSRTLQWGKALLVLAIATLGLALAMATGSVPRHPPTEAPGVGVVGAGAALLAVIAIGYGVLERRIAENSRLLREVLRRTAPPPKLSVIGGKVAKFPIRRKAG